MTYYSVNIVTDFKILAIIISSLFREKEKRGLGQLTAYLLKQLQTQHTEKKHGNLTIGLKASTTEKSKY